MAVPYSRPSIDDEDIAAVNQILRSGWLAFGRDKELFEEEFADYVGVRHAVSLNSCTSALELALKAYGIRGEVVVPSFTWVATANAVVNAGARPVFCDVDLHTRNMTAENVLAMLSPRTEAVILVHYGGQVCVMEPLVTLCASKGLVLIEDCAETLGGTCAGRKAGSFGTGCFSFYPTKAMTTGEGGMLTIDDPELAARVRTISSHGVPTAPPLSGETHKPWMRSAVAHGHNYRLPNILAGLGRSQLRRLDAMNERRIALAARYDAAFTSMAEIAVPAIWSGHRHVYQTYAIQVSAAIRDSLLARLWAEGVAANVHFDPPVHRQPAFATVPAEPLPATERLARELLSLPIYPDMSEAEQAVVVAAVSVAVRDLAR